MKSGVKWTNEVAKQLEVTPFVYVSSPNTHMNTQTHTHIHTHACTHTHTHTLTHTHTHTHTHTPIAWTAQDDLLSVCVQPPADRSQTAKRFVESTASTISNDLSHGNK